MTDDSSLDIDNPMPLVDATIPGYDTRLDYPHARRERRLERIREMDIEKWAVEQYNHGAPTEWFDKLVQSLYDDLDEEIRDAAAAEGYDYVYHCTEMPTTQPLGRDGLDAFAMPDEYVMGSDTPPEYFTDTLGDEFDTITAYDLREFSEGERELLSAGFIPARLLAGGRDE